MADDEANLALMRSCLTTPKPAARRDALRKLLDLPVNLLPTSFILKLLSSAPSFSDRASVSLSSKLIHSHAGENLAGLTKRLRQLTKSLRRSPPLGVRVAHNQCRLLRPLLQIDEAREAALAFFVATIACIESSASCPRSAQRRAQDHARRAAYRIARRCVADEKFVSALLATAEAFAKNRAEAIAALGVLVAAQPDIAAHSGDSAKRFLAAVGNVALKAKSAAAQDVARVAVVALGQVPSEVAEEYLVPALGRALVREPEAAVSALPPILLALKSCDLSVFTTERVAPAIVAALKSADEKTRAGGVALAKVIPHRARDEKALHEAVVQLCALFKDARYAYQRTAAAQALRWCVLGARSTTHIGLACKLSSASIGHALEAIVNWLEGKKETNAEARSEGYQTVLCFLRENGAVYGDAANTKVCQDASSLLCSCVSGGKSKDEEKSALEAFVRQLECIPSLSAFVDFGDLLKKLSTAATGVGRAKQEDAVRALAIIAVFGGVDDIHATAVRDSAVWTAVGDAAKSQLVSEPARLSSEIDAKCVLKACEWFVSQLHPQSELFLMAIFKLATDERVNVSDEALGCIRRLRANGDDKMAVRMVDSIWTSLFSTAGAADVPSSPYDFNDNGFHAELVGAALLSTVVPSVPLSCAPKVLLAAHYPRLVREAPDAECLESSRWWRVCQNALPKNSTADSDGDTCVWLESCLETLMGDQGLKSGSTVLVEAAVNALGGLAMEFALSSDCVVRLGLPMLQPLVQAAPNLSQESLDAVRATREAKVAAEKLAEFKADLSAAKGKKGAKETSNGHVDQRKQAQLDKSRAIETSAKAAIEKAETVKSVAEEAHLSFQYTSAALRALRSLVIADASHASIRIPDILRWVMSCAKYEHLHLECRRALFAIARSGDRLLRGMALQLSCTLFGLAENRFDMDERVTSIIGALSRAVPPAFDSLNFALFAPVLRAALLKDPNLEDQGISSGGRGSTKRRDAIAVVRSAALILLEHCKPEAVDAAVAAAAVRAGTWAIQVMEREDGAFAAAADSLAALAGTALTPGTEQLSQVVEGVISGKSSVRDGALCALGRIPQLAMPNVECPRDSLLGRTLWLARFDPDEANAELAEELWTNYKHPLHVSEDTSSMLQLLSHGELDVRTMAACGIANALQGEDKMSVRVASIPQLFSIYIRNMHAREGEEKELLLNSKKSVNRGRDKNEVEFDAAWVGRHGVALTIEKLATTGALTLKDASVVFSFLAGRGLGDPNDKVRAMMSTAATAVVNAAGSDGPTAILPMIETHLNSTTAPSASDKEIAHADRTRENLVMCLGTLAGYLPADDPRVPKTADQVIRCAVETPSELVQNAAARCLVPLARLSFSQERENAVRQDLMKKVWNAQSSYGERRGACYALAGLCRGRGLKAMKRMQIIEELESAVVDKSPRKRMGAFLIIETHAILLGRLFEPFTVSCLPHLLMCMGDTVVEVRNACWAASQAAVSEMSSQGVKMILPSLLSGLQERQWRTRAGAAEVLGAMAFCAPRQLAQCLPQVVPKLAEALADAHTRVIEAAEAAINRIAAVVRSPEVRNLSPFLLAALKDPAGRTRGAVDAMLGTEFVHAIDPASLALLIPPLHRGLRDRSTELKKRAAAIVGSMCNNVLNQSDVGPYLHLLLPDLRTTLLDAIPDVRKTSARAIGALAVALGEDGLPDIVSWLMNALLGTGRSSKGSRNSEYIGAVISSSSAERSGAAMGLAEVSASLSEQRLEEVLKHVLSAGDTNGESREGGLMLIACMPRALGERFESRLSMALSSILAGLSDDSDNVREAALEAGRNLVQAYAKSSLEHLLPELMSAMKDKLWRIRQAAARLLGDFLLVIAGALPTRSDVFGVVEPVVNDESEHASEDDEDGEEKEEGAEDRDSQEEDEQFESPEAQEAAMTIEATMNAIEEVLGWDRRNEVLAALFIIRCDVSSHVRQMGFQVWKTVVSNTPRVLREIMPTAVRQVVDGLGDEDPERRAAAGKALGDLSLKLGDRVIPEVLPALRAGIVDKTASARVRRGACEGLVELVEACPHHQLVEHATDLVAVVYQALCDTLPVVRATAAGVFSTLLTPLGDAAVDAVVPLLIGKISGAGESDVPQPVEDANRALDALKQILRASGNRLMAIVVPRLTEETPLSLTSARALAAAAQVAEGAFEDHVVEAIEASISTLEEPVTTDLTSALEDITCAVVVASDTSSRALMDVISRSFNEGSPWRRAATSRLCGCICRGTPEVEVAKLASSLYEILIRQLGDPDADTVSSSWDALLDLSKNVPLNELASHIGTIRQSLRSVAAGVTVGDSSTTVAGMQLPKAPAPFIPVFSEGLLRGAPEVREQSALAIAELIEMTSVASLKSFVVKIAGPLIRVMSERFPWQIRAAILRAMTVLLEKCAPMLRAFAPQLQSTLVKCLSDGSRLVRVRACSALGCLVPIQTRLEPLLNDLAALGATGASTESRVAAYHGCSQIYKHGVKLPESAFSRVAESIAQGVLDDEAEVAVAAGRALGQVASRSRSPAEFSQTLDLARRQLDGQGVEYSVRVHALQAVGSVFTGGERVADLDVELLSETIELIQVLMTCVTPPVQGAACHAGARALSLLVRAPGLINAPDAAEHRRALVAHISGRAEFDDSPEVRVAALEALAVAVVAHAPSVGVCAPALVVCAGVTNTAIRGAAERVMRKAFVNPKDLSVKKDVVEMAKDALSEEDQTLVDRRLPKLRVVSESDDEGDN